MLWTDHQTTMCVGEDRNANRTGSGETAPGTGQQTRDTGRFPLVSVQQAGGFGFCTANRTVMTGMCHDGCLPFP